ncbi:DNA-binding transcriptional regulator of glucitol operon [Tsukamurella pulmonis]|uniref:DNA-binding transcriptional regulator of glucitol operon n=1 Tax=Tsukamurella pulmonis TaxID=47312 RepID=A0A1H1DA60_9ACTN|nr:DNA-binding transcriptional regulator of glucitol operon [Tsukamurella pulmonis]
MTGTVEDVKRRRHRPALIAFVVIAAAAFLALGWWQWGRFESSAGSARNLGYALQWPLFAVAAVWGYRRFVQLEDEAQLQDELAAQEMAADPQARAAETPAPEVSAARAVAAPPRPATKTATKLTAIPEGFLPSRAGAAPSAPEPAPDDPAHDEYNRLLAELAGSEHPEETK